MSFTKTFKKSATTTVKYALEVGGTAASGAKAGIGLGLTVGVLLGTVKLVKENK